MVYLFLADGFEELEAIAPIDCLRRGGFNIATVGVGAKIVESRRGIKITADISDDELTFSNDIQMIILPGGMPGTTNLERSVTVQKAISFCASRERYIAAICAAPSILGHMGLLKGERAVCFPGFESHLKDAIIENEAVCVSNKFITARGAGVALEFGLKLVEVLSSKEKSDKIRAEMQC